MKKVIFLIFFSFIIIGLSYPQEQKASYKVGPGDTLEISVYQEDDLEKIVRVSEEGKIIYPLVGEVEVAGLTPKDIAKKIEVLLEEDFLVDAQVSVFIKEYSKFFVVGEVRQEGGYELKGPFTILDAIALAGGATRNADLSRIKVIRKYGDEEKEYIIDLDTQGNTFSVKPLDRIIVEEYGEISVLGEVNKSGNYYLKEETALLDALALAEGATANADLSKIKVIRKKQAPTKEYILDAHTQGGDFFLMDKDIVFVEPYAKVSIIGQVNQPGNYYLKKNLTVVDLIAMAGGFTDIASQNGVKVIRKEQGVERTITIPVSTILRSGDRSRDIILQEGDTVVVPESFF